MQEIARNKRAYVEYELGERLEAGIELKGFEVKSAKLGRFNLAGSYASLKGGEVWLINADIAPYQPENTPPSYDPRRERRLLLSAAEIKFLTGRIKEAGLTLVPLRAYIKGRLIKLELALARHKKKKDKREAIQRREIEREIKRTLKI
jgi:SsrA-binding protein